MNKETLWHDLYIGRTINREIFDKRFYPNGTRATEYICEFLDAYQMVAWELYAFIDNDRVTSIDPIKYIEHDTGHFRPSGEFKKLTLAEKKKSVEVLDACFPDQAADELNPVIDKAVSTKAAYDGYIIEKRIKDNVSYQAPDGSKGRISVKRILQALDYTHVDLSILREAACCEMFSLCFDKKPFQPLMAVLSVVTPEEYDNFDQLDLKYKREKLTEALKAGDIQACERYRSVLRLLEKEIPGDINIAIRSNNMELMRWLLENTKDLSYDLLHVLSDTICYRDNHEAVELILNSGKFSTDVSNLYDPLHEAYKKNDIALQVRLVKLGFKGSIQTELLTDDEIKELIPYGLKPTDDLYERAVMTNDSELMNYIIQCQIADGMSWWLLQKYVSRHDYESFDAGLKKGFDYQNKELFELCLDNGFKWSDRLLEAGYDINTENGIHLDMAVSNRNLDRAKYLIDHGADPHLNGRWGTTSLGKISANPKGHWMNNGPVNEELCVYLFAVGVDFSKALGNVFHTMSFETKKTFIDILKERDLLNVPDGEGHLPIYYAASNYRDLDDGTIEYFIKQGSVVNAAGITEDRIFYETFTHYTQYDHIWEQMIELGADVNEQWGSHTALVHAMMKDCPIHQVECLLQAGADPNILFYDYKMKSGDVTALDYAMARDNKEMINLLKSYGAKKSEEL